MNIGSRIKEFKHSDLEARVLDSYNTVKNVVNVLASPNLWLIGGTYLVASLVYTVHTADPTTPHIGDEIRDAAGSALICYSFAAAGYLRNYVRRAMSSSSKHGNETGNSASL